MIGKWEFKIDIKDVIKNSDELTGFEKLAARTFSGAIEKALDRDTFMTSDDAMKFGLIDKVVEKRN